MTQSGMDGGDLIRGQHISIFTDTPIRYMAGMPLGNRIEFRAVRVLSKMTCRDESLDLAPNDIGAKITLNPLEQHLVV